MNVPLKATLSYNVNPCVTYRPFMFVAHRKKPCNSESIRKHLVLVLEQERGKPPFLVEK